MCRDWKSMPASNLMAIQTSEANRQLWSQRNVSIRDSPTTSTIPYQTPIFPLLFADLLIQGWNHCWKWLVVWFEILHGVCPNLSFLTVLYHCTHIPGISRVPKFEREKRTQVGVLYFEATKNLHLLMLTICRSFHLFSHHIICQKFAIPSLSHRCCCNLQGRWFKPCCISMKWVCVVALSRVPPCALSRQG